MLNHDKTIEATTGMIKQRQQKVGVVQNAPSRSRQVRRSVIIIDRIADRVITIGGILVIMAVLGILVFLVVQTVPLFMGGKTTGKFSYTLNQPLKNILHAGIDEYKTITHVVQRDGKIVLFHARTGKSLKKLDLGLQGHSITTASVSFNKHDIALGLDDGTIRLIRIDYKTAIVIPQNLPQNLVELDERDQTNGSEIFSKIPGDNTDESA